jgi:hypothetical protein
MRRHDCKQGSDEWLQLRLGIPTASEFDRILTPSRLKLAAASETYMHLKLAEWMYGAPLETYDVGAHGWGARGKELEPEAVRYYEMERECETDTVGLVTTDDGMIGASPDRLVGEDGLYEGKAPALETHVGYMLDPQSLVDEYRLQVQGQLWVCQRAWCDMHSYSPGFPSVIVRVLPDPAVHAALAQHVPAFVDRMLRCREELTAQYGELRRERNLAEARRKECEAAFDAYMDSPIGGVV